MEAKINPHAAIQLLLSCGSLLICALLIFLITVICLCGGNSLLFIAVLGTDGAAAFGWLAGATGLGAVVLQLFRIRTNRLLFIATAAGLGLGIFSLLGLGLGLVGWLNRPVAIGFPIASILIWVVTIGRNTLAAEAASPVSSVLKSQRVDLPGWLRLPVGAGWIWLVPLVSFTIALVAASYLPGILWKPLDPHPYDVTGYHLLVPREWYEAGRIIPLQHNVYSFFEMNVEVHFLLLMHALGGPFAAMYACQFLCAGCGGMMVLAVVGATEQIKGERPTSNVEHRTSKLQDSSLRRSTFDVQSSTFAFSSFLAASLASTVPWVIMLGGVAYVESTLMLYTALAIGWGLYATKNPQHLFRALILAGILAGLACGVKITAVPMLLAALPVAMLIVRPTKRVLLACVLLVFVGMLIVSPWLVRNEIWAGNPLFPVAMKTLGSNHFDSVQVQRFHDAHSPTAAEQPFSARLQILLRDVLSHWQFGYLLLPFAGFAFASRWRDPQMRFCLICFLFVLVVWIGFTHLLPRFLVMLIPISAIAIGQMDWKRFWPIGIVALLAAAVFSWSRVVPELMHQPAIIGMQDTSFMMQDAPQLIDAHDRGMQIGLVGDAQAFLYPFPLKNMHYRAVFNLYTSDDPIKAWLGDAPVNDPDWLLVINPREIDRLHRTYHGVPGVPPDWQQLGPNVFFLRGGKLQK